MNAKRRLILISMWCLFKKCQGLEKRSSMPKPQRNATSNPPPTNFVNVFRNLGEREVNYKVVSLRRNFNSKRHDVNNCNLLSNNFVYTNIRHNTENSSLLIPTTELPKRSYVLNKPSIPQKDPTSAPRMPPSPPPAPKK